MLNIFNKIPNKNKPQFSMPLSLRLIKECSINNIDWKCLHIADLYSILYSIRIDNAINFLEQQRMKRMHEKGISSISKATEQDFDNL